MSYRETCFGPPGSSCRWRRVLAFSLAGMGLVLGSSTIGSSVLSSAKKPLEFKDAIKAQDKGDWKTSIPLMRLALEKQPEDGEQVRIYGTKFKSYLPHFYLGLALYKQHDCTGALKEWEQCLKTEVVQATEEYPQLLAYRANCKNQS